MSVAIRARKAAEIYVSARRKTSETATLWAGLCALVPLVFLLFSTPTALFEAAWRVTLLLYVAAAVWFTVATVVLVKSFFWSQLLARDEASGVLPPEFTSPDLLPYRYILDECAEGRIKVFEPNGTTIEPEVFKSAFALILLFESNEPRQFRLSNANRIFKDRVVVDVPLPQIEKKQRPKSIQLKWITDTPPLDYAARVERALGRWKNEPDKRAKFKHVLSNASGLMSIDPHIGVPDLVGQLANSLKTAELAVGLEGEESTAWIELTLTGRDATYGWISEYIKAGDENILRKALSRRNG